MYITNLYSELQSNPKNLAVYRKISEFYKKNNHENEHLAFEDLIKRKFYANSSSIDQKQ